MSCISQGPSERKDMMGFRTRQKLDINTNHGYDDIRTGWVEPKFGIFSHDVYLNECGPYSIPLSS